MVESSQQILLNLGQDFLGELDIKTHHFFDLLAPLVNDLIDYESSVKHRCIFHSKNRVRGTSHPFRIKTRVIEDDINEEHHPFFL